MKVSVGKPVLAAMSVACIAVPAATGVASAATPASPISPVRLAAAAAAPVDPALALLNLVTFPIHNAVGVAIGVGTAANAGLNLVLLPVTIASLIATNGTAQIPANVQRIETDLANAFPKLIQSIQAEVAYDQSLFANLGVTQAAQTRPNAADVSAVTAAAAAPVDPALALLNLATLPIHNIVALAVAVGSALNPVLNLALLPVTIASFVITNRTAEIPGQVQMLETSLANAIPTLIKNIQTEVDYTKSVFSSLGIAAPQLPAMAALEAPQVKKIAADTEADAPKALAAGDSSKDSTPTDSTPAKDSKPSDTTPAKDDKPSDTTPAKDDKPSDTTPPKDDKPSDSTPAKDGKPGKTGVHHQGGAATGTNGAANGQNAGDAGKPSNSTPSKHTGAGKHRAAAGARSAGAGSSTGHGRHAKK
jgi:hypothetical protein